MSLFLGVAAGAAIAAPSPSSGASDIVPVIPDPLSGKEEQVTKLPNGLSVLILKDTRFPLVSTRLYVHAGSSYETPDQAGISHVLEHMVFKGTDSRPKSAISQEVESAGGYLNAATSYDYTVYITDMPDRHWKLGMDVVRDMAFHPTLDPQELESEKNVIVAELQRGEDDPGSRMFKTLLADTLKGTPYDRPIIGYEKTIRALTTQNLRDYIAKYYQPQNMLLVVVGNVDPAEVLAEAEKMFAPYKNTAPLKEVMPYEADRLPLPGSKPALVVQPGPWNKVYLAAALPVPGSSSYQSATLDVLAYLLGGDRTSLFYKTYKYERQLVDSISVSNVSFERIGAFVVTAELDADKVEPFWTSLTKDFAALDASTFTPEQLERAKLNLEDDLYRSKETLSGLASKIGYFQFFMGGDQGERNAIEALRNVDNGMLKQVLAAWVQPDRLTTVVLPPKDTKMPDMQAILDKEWKSGAKASAAKTAEAGKTEVIDLGKGRTVVLIPDKTLPYVSANLTYSGGDALLKPSEQGLSALVSNVLTKGTAKRSATEMQAFLADRAAGLAASAGRKTFSVTSPRPPVSTRICSICSARWSRPPRSARTKPPAASRISSRPSSPAKTSPSGSPSGSCRPSSSPAACTATSSSESRKTCRNTMKPSSAASGTARRPARGCSPCRAISTAIRYWRSPRACPLPIRGKWTCPSPRGARGRNSTSPCRGAIRPTSC